MSSYEIVPITLRQAQDFVNAHHRHNSAPVGHRFSLGIADGGGALIGVAIVGRPIARRVDDGVTAEVLRVCVLDSNRNANSMLYGAACRAAKAIGYKRIVTYTLKDESGSSLKAAGFTLDGDVRLNSAGWDVPGRRRNTLDVSVTPKQRWSKNL